MKCSLILIATIALVYTGYASPIEKDVEERIPKDNSHYVEGESRYVWMSDDVDGELQLVDLLEPVDEEMIARNGANNQYWLFTRQNRNNAQILVNGNINSVRNSNYGSNRPINVIAHGWNNNGNSGVNTEVRNALLDRSDCNVIVVDWRALANTGYATAAAGVPNVGEHIGNFLVWLINNAGGNWNNVHLIGYSLGAHVVGNAGRQAGGRASRVTGLDPAGPSWHGNSRAMNANDGQYVEAIHTSTLGINNPIGRANFYPNGGTTMPGCGVLGINCSHGRSYQYFASTVRTNHLIGRQCTNINQASQNSCTGASFPMGNDILSKRGSGLYAMTTGANFPF